MGAGMLLAHLSEGRHFPPNVARALRRILGMDVSRDGFARLFQPSFPGVRAFVLQPRVAPDQAVEMTLVGIARNGRPVWTGSRAFVLGRDGSLEIHRGFDEIDPAFQHRNTTVDLLNREMELLRLTERGPASRLTIDAEGVGRYLCALHGLVFADETDEGPPVRSNRPFAPEEDRTRLIKAALSFIEEKGRQLSLGRIAIEGTLHQADRATSAMDLARLRFAGVEDEPVEGSDGQVGATQLGREFLLARTTPAWRAALYLSPRDESLRGRGEDYRLTKTLEYRRRFEEELSLARAQAQSTQRPDRIKGLETLGHIGSKEDLDLLQIASEGKDRRVASVARRMTRMIEGTDLEERMKDFAENEREDTRWRSLVLRVLAEHHPAMIEDASPMLRAYPDARIQRAVVPLVANAPQGSAELAAMLAANPRTEPRAGLLELRLELIERLAERADPMTLPVLIEQYASAHGSPDSPPSAEIERTQLADPAEILALSRALVAIPDPRARAALMEATRSFERPPVP